MKKHSSQGRGILAALLLAVFAGASLKAADAKFMVVAKGQRWMQTNASAAVAVPAGRLAAPASTRSLCVSAVARSHPAGHSRTRAAQ